MPLPAPRAIASAVCRSSGSPVAAALCLFLLSLLQAASSGVSVLSLSIAAFKSLLTVEFGNCLMILLTVAFGCCLAVLLWSLSAAALSVSFLSLSQAAALGVSFLSLSAAALGISLSWMSAISQAAALGVSLLSLSAAAV